MGAIEAIRSLPPRQREAVELRYSEGLTEPDIAARMRICDRRVRQLFQSARKRLAPAGINLPRPRHGRIRIKPASQFAGTADRPGMDIDAL